MSGKKILVLGSSGMAGHVITTYLEEEGEYEVADLSKSRKLRESSRLIDVCDFPRFEALLTNQRFDVIINCIGILNRNADAFKDKTVLLNAYLPHFLECRFKQSQTKVVHLSTDCVFSGKSGSYTENSFKDGESFYAKTKALGEICGGRNLTFRTSIIGPEINRDGTGLFHWFMKSKGEVNGYANSIWTGITTLELAKALVTFIREDVSGIYHLVPSESITKYDLLRLFKDVFHRNDIQINKFPNSPVDKSLLNTRRDFAYSIPSYEEMLIEMREWMLLHSSLYPYYKDI